MKEIFIAITYIGRSGVPILQRGLFPVRKSDFERDKYKTATDVARRFLRDIQREVGVVQVKKVLFEGEDITRLVV